jgi:hypothetical protein
MSDDTTSPTPHGEQGRSSEHWGWRVYTFIIGMIIAVIGAVTTPIAERIINGPDGPSSPTPSTSQSSPTWKDIGGVLGMENWCARRQYRRIVIKVGPPSPYWWCTHTEDGSEDYKLEMQVDMDSACQEEYNNPKARAVLKKLKDPGGWRCEAPTK